MTGPQDEDLEEQSRNSEHDRLGRELESLQGALEDKERLLRELQEKSKVSKLKETYDKVLKEATAENEELSKERSKLLKKLQVGSLPGFFSWIDYVGAQSLHSNARNNGGRNPVSNSCQ